MNDGIDRAAIISNCRSYRYDLWRSWSQPGKRSTPYLLWVMLNPSTADGDTDDATIRKCIAFTNRLGYCSLYVVNLFAWRTARPEELLFVSDPVGPLNDFYLGARAGSDCCAPEIIAAWGSLDFCRARPTLLQRVPQVMRELGVLPRRVMCLGTTKNGDPRHPYRLHYAAELQPFTLKGTAA